MLLPDISTQHTDLVLKNKASVLVFRVPSYHVKVSNRFPVILFFFLLIPQHSVIGQGFILIHIDL